MTRSSRRGSVVGGGGRRSTEDNNTRHVNTCKSFVSCFMKTADVAVVVVAGCCSL